MRDLAAIRAGLCGEQEEQKCAAENEDNLAWACSVCEKKKAADLHDYTKKLLRLRMLKIAGYPLAADDLTLEEWIDLGRLEQCLETPLK